MGRSKGGVGGGRGVGGGVSTVCESTELYLHQPFCLELTVF